MLLYRAATIYCGDSATVYEHPHSQHGRCAQKTWHRVIVYRAATIYCGDRCYCEVAPEEGEYIHEKVCVCDTQTASGTVARCQEHAICLHLTSIYVRMHVFICITSRIPCMYECMYVCITFWLRIALITHPVGMQCCVLCVVCCYARVGERELASEPGGILKKNVLFASQMSLWALRERHSAHEQDLPPCATGISAHERDLVVPLRARQVSSEHVL